MLTKRQIKAVAFAAVLLGLFVASWLLPLAAWVKAFADWVESQGAFGVVLFVCGYILGIVLFVPAALLKIAAGIVFGVAWGALIALVSSTIGGTLSFLIGRYLARRAVESWAAKHEMFRALDAALGANDWRVICLLHLSPVVPFSLGNYLYGITKARLWAYVTATLVGMAPASLLCAYLGHVGITTLGKRVSEMSTLEIVYLIVGLAATVAVTWYLTRLARKELEQDRWARAA